MNRQSIQEQLQALEQERVACQSNLDRIAGATILCRGWLAKLEQAETAPALNVAIEDPPEGNSDPSEAL